jgi:zinc protease
MKTLLAIPLMLAALPTVALAAETATAVPAAPVPIVPAGEIDVDPSILRGSLDNGLVYFVRENQRPKSRAQLRLVVKAGSVDEDEDQLGFAHFLEHMLFNGTENYPGNEIVEYLESIGARFGADLNAYTSFDETVYMLEIPTDGDGLLEKGISVLHEFASRATIETEEVERERGVVLDEWRRRLGAGSRVRDQQLPIVLKGSRYAERLPIGDPEILRSGDPEAIRRFYRDWYRPERMAVIAVGDFDAAEVVERIRSEFGSIPPSTALRERGQYDVPAQPDTLWALAEDEELRGTSVGFSTKREARPEAATWEAYREGVVEQLAIGMFNDRLFEISRSPQPPFLGAGMGVSPFGSLSELVSVSARVAAGGEGPGLEAVLLETRRAREHGFLASELERARADLLAGIEAAAAERGKTPSRRYVSEYTRHFLRGEPIPGIEAELEFARAAVPGIGVEECAEAFRALTGGGGLVIEASRPSAPDLPGEAELGSVLAAAAAAPLEPWVDTTAGAVLVADPAPAGRIVERNRLEEIGVTELVLSNGLHVYVKPTEFQDDTIVFHGAALGGTSRADDAELLSAEMASGIVAESGWGGHSPVDLERLLAGKVASARPYFQERWHGVSGSSTVQDFPTALDLAVLVMTAPNEDAAAFARWRERLSASLANRASDPSSKYFDRLTEINTSAHPRTRPLTPERLGEIDPATSLAFYRECFRNASDFAFFVVGNVDPVAIEPEIERTLGSLPNAGGEASVWVDRRVLFPEESVRETVRAGREPKAATSITLASYGGTDPDEWHRLRTACSILERRLRESLREDLGGTYGVGASYRWSLVGPARGTISIRFGSSPEEAEALAEQALAVLAQLQESGPTAEELGKERELQTREVETSWEQNGFWLGNLYGLWLRGRDLTEVLDRQARIDALDEVAIARVLREHFDRDRMTWVDWLPAEAAEAVPEGAAVSTGTRAAPADSR